MEKNSYWKKYRINLMCSLPFFAGILAGFALFGNHNPASSTSVIRENPAAYHFINPILYVSDGTAPSPQLSPLRKSISDYISQSTANGLAEDVSVYIKEFNHEYWTGVNENEPYTPSSMLKVSIMMAYLKIAETDPSIMSEKTMYTAEVDPGQFFKPGAYLTTGLHTNAEIIDNMIKESDNAAEKALSENILNSSRHNIFAQVFLDLHMPLPKEGASTDFLSVKQYSRLFRALYNGAYLPNAYSENALDLLSNTTFKEGIVAGVPEGVVVAHKFGEHSLLADDGSVQERQLHDCGIIYKPENPYLLCIMTRGKDFNSLSSILTGISDIVYKNIGSVK